MEGQSDRGTDTGTINKSKMYKVSLIIRMS